MSVQNTMQSLLEPFLDAARDVLGSELGYMVRVGPVGSFTGSATTQDVTVLVGVTGELEGNAIYSYSVECAIGIVSAMLGSPVEQLDELAQSGIAELGNMITGRACMRLATNGYTCNIAPPMLLLGHGVEMKSLHLPRWSAAIELPYGPMEIHLSLRKVG